MYPVSEAFLNAVKANTRKYYWTGRIDIEEYVDLFRIGNGRQNGRLQVKAFTDADELSLVIRQRCCGNDLMMN